MRGRLDRRRFVTCGLLAGLLFASAIPTQAVGQTFPTERVEPIRWRFPIFGLIAGTNSVVIEVNSGTCGGPTIDHVEVRPGPRQHDRFTTTITVYGRWVITEHPQPPPGVIYACDGVGLTLT